MEKKSNMGLVIGLVIVIIILGVLCLLFATNTITFNSTNKITSSNDISTPVDTGEESTTDLNDNTRDKYVSKLKEALTSDEWLKNNLYNIDSTFGEKINDISKIKFTFSVLSDNSGNPFIIVLAFNYDTDSSNNWVNNVYKVYYDGSNVQVVTVCTMHPGHGLYSIDVNQGYLIAEYNHTENNIGIFNVKETNVNKFDSIDYEDDDERDNFLKKYDIANTDSIDIELTNDNINTYLK